MTQTQLAERAGVSRQLIAAVETSRNTPAVDAALRLAAALDTTVEQLFSPDPPADTEGGVVPALGTELAPGQPVRVARVGELTVAGTAQDLSTATGVAEATGVRLFGPVRDDELVLAGCEPAMAFAEALVNARGARPGRLLTLNASSGVSRAALEAGRVHAAVVHGPPGALSPPPVEVKRFRLARWPVGFGVPAGWPPESAADVLRREGTIVQREEAAAAQEALQRVAAGLGVSVPEGPRAEGHAEAARLGSILRAPALTTQAAALAAGLRFLPLELHEVQLWVAAQWAHHPGALALVEVLGAGEFTRRASALPGYDLTGCGSAADPAESNRSTSSAGSGRASR